MRRFASMLAFTLVALSGGSCKRHVNDAEPASNVPIPPPVTESSADQESAPPGRAAAREIEEGEPLEAGFVIFSGMARPTKGGLDVRGVTFAVEGLSEALPPKDGRPRWTDDLLGAQLRIEAELVSWHHHEGTGPVAIQSRSGDGFRARQLIRAEVVNEAVVVEGEVSRSKGLYQVGTYLVSREDLEWSLLRNGRDAAGLRVRLWGQPHVVVCEPNVQCLVGGKIPMFDIARAKILE